MLTLKIIKILPIIKVMNAHNKFSVLLFDLDGTLYDINNGYIENQKKNIYNFLISNNISSEINVNEYWNSIFSKYNQTLRGLQEEGHIINEAEYWKFIRQDMSKYLKNDSKLQIFLSNLPKGQKKYIFTNCNEREAEECLKCIGIDHLFDGIYGASFMNRKCKPEKEVFHQIVDTIGIKEYSKYCLFEDSVKNLDVAKSMGMGCVLIDSNKKFQKQNTYDCITCTLSNEKGLVAEFPKLYLS